MNRFTRVWVDRLERSDLSFIVSALHPAIGPSDRDAMIAFNAALHEDTMVRRAYGLDGSPWEFNLRDAPMVRAAPSGTERGSARAGNPRFAGRRAARAE